MTYKWKIGDLEISGPIVLGPMAGVTNKAYREFMKPFGVDVLYTEMISDFGIIYDNENTLKYLAIGKDEHPIGLQLFGGKKEVLLNALKKIEESQVPYDFLDINLGCPMPKILKGGAGSAWLGRLEELYEMMSSLVQASKKPVTAKIRIGLDEKRINVFEVVELLEKAGVKMICIHTRTTKQIYSGTANHEIIRDLGLKMKIPLVISGDIFTPESALAALNTTKATAVLLARGSLGQPHKIRQIREYLLTQVRIPDLSLNEQLGYLWEFAQKITDYKGEFIGMKELRGIGVHFLSGYSGIKNYKSLISTISSLEELKNLIDEMKISNF